MRVVFFPFKKTDITMIKNGLIKTTKVSTYLVHQTQTTCQLGSTTVTTTTKNHKMSLFFSQVCIAVRPMLLFFCFFFVLMMLAIEWSSLFVFLFLISGCSCSHCPTFQVDPSVPSLSGVGCRLFLMPHTSGMSAYLLPLRCGLQAVLNAPYFRYVCQSPPSQLWAAGGS